MDNNLQDYHDRVRRLMESVNRLQESVQSFASNLGIDTTQSQSANAQSLVANIDISNFGAIQPTETAEHFEDVRKESENVADIVNGIDIDELMANVNTEAMIP